MLKKRKPKPYRVSNKNEYYDPLFKKGLAPERESVYVSEIKHVTHESYALYRFKIVKNGEVYQTSVAATDFGAALVTLYLNIKDQPVELEINAPLIKDILEHTVRENMHLSAALITGIVYGSKTESGVPVSDITEYTLEKAGLDLEALKKELRFALNLPGLRRALALSEEHYLLDRFNDDNLGFDDAKKLYFEITALTGLYPLFLQDLYDYIITIYSDVNKPDPEDDMVLEDV